MRFLRIFFRKRDTDVEDGGVQKHVQRDVPKTVVSENIIRFTCKFSTVAIADEIPIEHGVYTLSASLTDGAVRAEYDMRTRHGSGERFAFRDSHRFMRRLQDVVRAHDLARFNGEEYSVSGLPDMYGAKIHIVYASGERIDASDNQSNFLSIEAMSSLAELFLSKKEVEK